MKRVLILAALALAASGGVALAAEPGTVAQLVQGCCDLAGACRDACAACCETCADCLEACADHCRHH